MSKRLRLIRKDLVQRLISIEDLSNSCKDNFYVFPTVDLEWTKLNLEPSIQLVDGLISAENLFYIYPYYKYHFTKNILTTDSRSMSYFRRIGINSNTYTPLHMKMNVEFDESAPVLITTSSTPYKNNKEKIQLIEFMIKIIGELKHRNVDCIFRIKDTDIYDTLKINESDNYLDDFPTKLSGLITTPSSIIYSCQKNSVPVLQIFHELEPVFVQSGWMSTTSNLRVKRLVDSFMKREQWRLNFQHNEILVPLENTKYGLVDPPLEIDVSSSEILKKAILLWLKSNFKFYKSFINRFKESEDED